MSTRKERQARIGLWVLAAFGKEQAASLPHRGIRMMEEAIELAQAAGTDKAMIHKLVDFVYDRPVGEIGNELGGLGVTMLALANAAEAIERERDRCAALVRALVVRLQTTGATGNTVSAAQSCLVDIRSGKDAATSPAPAADASPEARAKRAAQVYDTACVAPDDNADEQAWLAVVRAVDASRPASPAFDAEDLWTDYRTGRGTVFASDRKAFLAGVEAGRRTSDASRPVCPCPIQGDGEEDLRDPACPIHGVAPSRPGLTEEQAREIVRGIIDHKIATGMSEMRLCIAAHELTCAIAPALLRASRGETGP